MQSKNLFDNISISRFVWFTVTSPSVAIKLHENYENVNGIFHCIIYSQHELHTEKST